MYTPRASFEQTSPSMEALCVHKRRMLLCVTTGLVCLRTSHLLTVALKSIKRELHTNIHQAHMQHHPTPLFVTLPQVRTSSIQTLTFYSLELRHSAFLNSPVSTHVRKLRRHFFCIYFVKTHTHTFILAGCIMCMETHCVPERKTDEYWIIAGKNDSKSHITRSMRCIVCCFQCLTLFPHIHIMSWTNHCFLN